MSTRGAAPAAAYNAAPSHAGHSMTHDSALSALLSALPAWPGGPSLGDSGAQVRVEPGGGQARVEVATAMPVETHAAALEGAMRTTLQARGLALTSLRLRVRIPAHAVQPGLSPLANVRNIIAVGSGKGGVGKSTTAVNLALALAQGGARVGVLDADIYGPSIPLMLGVSARPESPDGKTIEPVRAHGVEAMSIGLLVDTDTPMIWRGPMATSALGTLLNDTHWGGDEGLDVLVVDLPPGTGDIQLTLAQKIPVAGAVIVTTPQDVATLDATKALKMFEKVNVPVLGLIENMAMHACTQCGHVEHVFGSGGGARMAHAAGVPLLASLPLDVRVREQADAGVPIVVAEPDGAAARAYREAALALAMALAGRPRAASGIDVSLV